jgi:hypothetical protein
MVSTWSSAQRPACPARRPRSLPRISTVCSPPCCVGSAQREDNRRYAVSLGPRSLEARSHGARSHGARSLSAPAGCCSRDLVAQGLPAVYLADASADLSVLPLLLRLRPDRHPAVRRPSRFLARDATALALSPLEPRRSRPRSSQGWRTPVRAPHPSDLTTKATDRRTGCSPPAGERPAHPRQRTR